MGGNADVVAISTCRARKMSEEVRSRNHTADLLFVIAVLVRRDMQSGGDGVTSVRCRRSCEQP